MSAHPKRRRYAPLPLKLEVKRSSAGRGLFAGEAIPRGACIIEYIGREISEEEKYTSRSKYLFEVNSRITLDGKPSMNKAGYTNHSCTPNAEPYIYRNRLYFFSRRRIAAGEEITLDYGKNYFDAYIKPKGCRCAACAKKRALQK